MVGGVVTALRKFELQAILRQVEPGIGQCPFQFSRGALQIGECFRPLRAQDGVDAVVIGIDVQFNIHSAEFRRIREAYDRLRETWERTNLQHVRPGSLVNLERSLRADARLGGHFVTGHIDGVGCIAKWERSGPDWVLDVKAPADVMRYLVFKGSIAVDGISLTVAAVRKGGFRIWIIPHTWEVTALRERQVGDAVNLEADLVGKYVEQMLRQMDLKRR